MTPERKRQLLIALCEAQRDEVACLAVRLDVPLKIADRGIAVVQFFRARPLALGALVALLTASRGRGFMKWAQRGVLAYRAYRALTR